MAKKHLSLKPHKVTNDFWWYEENGGITLCVEYYQQNGFRKVSTHKIKWHSIRAALKRKDRK